MKPPPAAIEAHAADTYERTVAPMQECREIAEHGIAAALPHLLAGEDVTQERNDLRELIASVVGYARTLLDDGTLDRATAVERILARLDTLED